MSHPRGGWAPRGRGGYHAGPVFQAKRWVKPGSAAAVAAEAAEAAAVAAATPGSEAAPGGGQQGAPHAGDGTGHGPPPQPPVVAGGGGARKWVKGQGVSGPKPVPVAPRPPPPERGRLSVFVGNLDPNVTEDNLWRFFGQAGRVNRCARPLRRPQIAALGVRRNRDGRVSLRGRGACECGPDDAQRRAVELTHPPPCPCNTVSS